MTTAWDDIHAAHQLVQESRQGSTMTLMLISSQALVGKGAALPALQTFAFGLECLAAACPARPIGLCAKA